MKTPLCTLIKTILRVFTLTCVLFAILAPAFPARATTAKNRAPGNQPKQRRGAQEHDRSAKADKQKLTALDRARELRRLKTPRHEKVSRQNAAAVESNSSVSLRDRVQSMIAMDETAGEDSEVRHVAVKALGNHAGTVVVMDPNTGRIYSIVNQQWALREGFKPCSTIKLVTGLAGLNERLIDTSQIMTIATGSGRDLTSALAHSNNHYFQQVGGRVGFEKFLFYARQLGLGEKTGINASNESAGSIPQYKSGFALNHMSSHGDDFQVTALQLATLISAMTNGGKLLSPFIPNILQEDVNVKPHIRRQVKIDTEVWSQMVPGMIGAVNYGSGRKAYNPLETIAGKTGTCIQDGTWVGLFASYAPLTNPRLAVVVIGLGPDGRGHFPAAVAGEIYRNLSHRFGMSGNELIANSTAPSYRQAAASDSNHAGEAHRAAGVNTNRSGGSNVRNTLWIMRETIGASTTKSVLMSVPKRTQGVNSTKNAKRDEQTTRPRRVDSINGGTN